LSDGPNIISDGHHQRSSAACAMARLRVPCRADSRSMIS